MEYSKKFKKLRIFNGLMVIIHLFQAILMFYPIKSSPLPITTSKLTSSHAALELATKTLTNVQIGPLIAIFLLISAVAHFLISTVL